MQKLHTDNAPEIDGRKTPFFKRARKEGIDIAVIEPNRIDENYSEICFGKANLGAINIMVRK